LSTFVFIRYQPRATLVKDENGDLFADSHNILHWWKNYFPQLLNVRRVSDVKQIEIDTAEPLVLTLSSFEVETAIQNLKNTIHQVVIKFQQN
jgi:hypothetical protein